MTEWRSTPASRPARWPVPSQRLSILGQGIDPFQKAFTAQAIRLARQPELQLLGAIVQLTKHDMFYCPKLEDGTAGWWVSTITFQIRSPLIRMAAAQHWVHVDA